MKPSLLIAVAALFLAAGHRPLLAQEQAPAEESRLPAGGVADTTHAFAAALDELLPMDPRVRAGVLANGLHYYIRENRRPEERAELRLVVDAGWMAEDDDQWGLAHFAEHMAFNGTRRFEKQELVDYLETIGMRFGPDVNAYTSYDETVYMLTVPTDSAQLVETGFVILREWADGVAFDSVEIEKERGVVLEELRGRRGASARLRRQQYPILFKGSRYAERIPDTPKEIETVASFEHETLKRFYRDWYRPDLMAVIAVGDFDAEWIESLIRQNFGDLGGPQRVRPRPTFQVPGHDETLYAIASDPELSQASVAVVYKLPVLPDETHGDYRRWFVERLYNSMLNSRFFEIAQSSEDPPFVSAGSGKGRWLRPVEAYSLGASVREGEIDRGLERVLLEAERVSRHGFTESELERQKADLLRSYERLFEERETSESATYASEYSRAFLEGEPFPGIAYEYALARRFLPRIALEEVNAIGRTWISDRSRVVLLSAPEKEGLPLPGQSDLASVFEAVEDAEVEPWEDASAGVPLLAEEPEPGRIVSERLIDEVEVTEWRLQNGVRVLIKPTDFKEDQVLFSARSPGGSSLASDEEYLSAAWSATLVSMGGVGEFSAVDLQKQLAGRVVTVGPTVGELEEGLSGSASPKDLETLFQLIYLHFTAPRRDSTAFHSFLSRMRVVLENRGAIPEAVYADTLAVTLFQHHPRRLPPTVDMLDEIDLEASLDFYRERFADAGDFTFIFVGRVTSERLRPLVERYLGSLPSKGRVETWRDVGADTPDGVVRRTVRRGLEPKARTSLVFTGPFDFERRNRYTLGSMVDVLRIMLRETLREEMGGTYGVSLSAAPVRDPRERYSLRVAFECDPERLGELTAATLATIDSLARHGASKENLAKVKETQRRERESDLRDNGFWLSLIDYYDRHDEDLRLILAYDVLVDGLTAEAIGEAARTYLRPDRYVEVSLLPEAEARSEAGPPEDPGTEEP